MSLLYRTIQSHVRDFESNLYTSVPAKVISFDPVECTVEVQPSVNEIDADGIVRVLPELGRVPLLMPNALNSALTFPVKEGDKVLLHFCQSNVEDYLLQSTEENPDDITPNTKRKHDLDDCFATLGVRFYDDSPVRREDTLDLYFKESRLTIESNGKIEISNDTASTKVTVESNGEVSIVEGNSASTLRMKTDGDIEIFSSKNLDISSVGVTTISGGQVVIQK